MTDRTTQEDGLTERLHTVVSPSVALKAKAVASVAEAEGLLEKGGGVSALIRLLLERDIPALYESRSDLRPHFPVPTSTAA